MALRFYVSWLQIPLFLGRIIQSFLLSRW